ncbi:cytosine permease [Acidocella aromatica]|uniref:NCS1 family nucleobase:cation symporter-1 n=1 Tax=Acidocella aromatica TaxID=1303579 RepID=A0A840VFP5_9PROT|nr:NCS1 family nucleobase:cation symporter-1 [Acidocella aromatica]
MNYEGSAAIKADKVGAVERHGIDPIPIADRHGSSFELFKLWVGANVNYVVIVTGAFALSVGVTFSQAVMAIVIGNLIGCLMVGLTSIQGPRTGTSGMMTSRACFGQLGSVLPKIVNVISALSWFSINSIVATQALEELFNLAGFGGHDAVWVALTLVLSAELIVAIYGHATIIAAEGLIAVVLAALFVGLAFFVVPHVPMQQLLAFNNHQGTFGAWLVALGVVVSYPIGWTNFASDYSRYFPSGMSWKKIALSAGLGQFVSLTLCEVIGVVFAIAIGGNLGNDPVSQLGHFLPTWFMIPLLIAVIFGGVAANVPNGYTASLGLLALRLPMTRLVSLAVIAVFTIGVRVAVVYYGTFFDVYQNFLNYMVFWTGPWAAIVIVDYFLRNGNYNSVDMMKWGAGRYWYQNGVFWPGVIAFAMGIIMSLAFSNSSTYASPLMANLLGWGDLSFEAGIISAGLVYWALARSYFKAIASAEVYVGAGRKA